jgi:PHD/YefM family antitoxin component YafN of YafNO toxin-antitoxin module
LRYTMAMKFITMRELRNQTTQVIEELDDETGVVTSNGKPVGILLRVRDDFEETIAVLRQARAAAAVSRLRQAARDSGRARLTEEVIAREVRAARKGRRD